MHDNTVLTVSMLTSKTPIRFILSNKLKYPRVNLTAAFSLTLDNDKNDDDDDKNDDDDDKKG